MKPAVLDRWAPRVEEALHRLLPPESLEPSALHRAMRYSVLAGGKRLRPVLAMSAYEACGGEEPEKVIPAAAAIEIFHTYSLIHDDLPAMDDDDLRRGKPSNHVVFGEATAILAGDALQSLGAQILSSTPGGPEWVLRRNRVCTMVLEALGSTGMAGGQAIDLQATGSREPPSEQILLTIHRLKTGRLIEASLQAGALWADAEEEKTSALAGYGSRLGLAFQIVDDILDETASSEVLGKTPGKDTLQGKATFPGLWGLETSRKEVQRIVEEAVQALSLFGSRGDDLVDLARYVAERQR